MATKQKQKRGRPVVYFGNVKKHIVSVIRKYGLSGAVKVLKKEGKDTPSLRTLGKFAKEAGIVLQRGHGCGRWC